MTSAEIGLSDRHRPAAGILRRSALHGRSPRTGSIVRYYRGSSDVTAGMHSSDGVRSVIGSHAHRQFRMTIRAAARAPIGATLPGSIKAIWTGDGTRIDLVKGIARVIR